MKHPQFSSFSVVMIFLTLAGMAQAQDPSHINSYCIFPTGTVFLHAVPGGGGDALGTQNQVQVYLKDDNGDPVVNFPRERLLLFASGWTYECNRQDFIPYSPYMLMADSNTDAAGWTTFSGAFDAGGWSNAAFDTGDDVGFCVFFQVQESEFGWSNILIPIQGHPDYFAENMIFNSSDINRDGIVNLSDVQDFTADYKGGSYSFRSDLYFDGVINLTDVQILSGELSAECQ